jgi:endonuclease YncB( thermonuclease family)
MRHLSFSAFAHTRRGHTLMAVGAMLALGVIAGAALKPSLRPPRAAAPALFAATAAQRFDPRLSYPTEVLRIIDGDTFAARVRVWPGLDVDTHVRLRGIDAAELHARCAAELRKALAARAALQTILAEGGVTIWHVGLDKYAGRVDAAVATRTTPDVSAAMLSGGFARRYDGGRRGSWCR